MEYADFDTQPSDATNRRILTVSELNALTREILEANFPMIWLEGEISNFVKPSSGHYYFTLKDENAQIRCAMFRMRNKLLNFTPKNGLQILARARVSLYEARGDFQLIMEHMEPTGDGALRRKYELLKQKLSDEGLFELIHKLEIPEFPHRIGVITSPSGAAVKDVLSVLNRRFPSIPVLIYPTSVQGDNAPQEIIAAITQASKRKECDVIILCRGGGSLEDLWAFNDENLARVIFDCNIPIVCGVGHEIDFTIADLVADVRAPTPSAAAELITPNADEWFETFVSLENRITGALKSKLSLATQKIQWLVKRLRHPSQRLVEQSQRTDELEQRLINATNHYLQHKASRLTTAFLRLRQQSPQTKISQLKQLNNSLNKRLLIASAHLQQNQKKRLSELSRALDAVSPLATLSRGYAIVKKLPQQSIVRNSAELEKGTQIETQVGKGSVISTVNEVKP